MEKLDRVRPGTLGAASRIEGVTPATLIELFVFLKKLQSKSRQER